MSSLDDAVNALIDAGLEPGRRIDRVNDAVPVGQVIRTEPEAGTEVEAGTTVDYFVSREAERDRGADGGAHRGADGRAHGQRHGPGRAGRDR